MKTLLPAALLLVVVAVWGWTFVVVKDAIASFPVVPFLALRFGIGAAAMAPFAAPVLRRRDLLLLAEGMQMPALIERGPLKLAISTDAAAPALSRRLREQLVSLLDSAGPVCIACAELISVTAAGTPVLRYRGSGTGNTSCDIEDDDAEGGPET